MAAAVDLNTCFSVCSGALLQPIIAQKTRAEVADLEAQPNELIEELAPGCELARSWELGLGDLEVGEEILEEAEQAVKQCSRLALLDQGFMKDLYSLLNEGQDVMTEL